MNVSFEHMKVHLIRTEGVDDDLFQSVLAFLNSIPGPYEFKGSREAREPDIRDELRLLFPDDERYGRQEMNKLMEFEADAMQMNTLRLLSWDDLFALCRKHRHRNAIPDKEPVILLTDYGNHPNWFAGYDKQARHFFVHTEQWEWYTGGESRYPIAYQVASILLKLHMFDSPETMLRTVHRDSRGCMMDFCEEKREIVLKLKTADICTDCMKVVQERHVPYALVRYTLDLFDAIRQQLLFRERYGVRSQPSRLLIRGWTKQLVLMDMGMLPVNLTPLERAVYLLFLAHPEGIRMSEVSDHRIELLENIRRMSRRDDPQVMERGVDELCSPLSNSLSEKMSKIRRKFVYLLGEEMADAYIIKGPNGGHKKIALDRELVVFD